MLLRHEQHASSDLSCTTLLCASRPKRDTKAVSAVLSNANEALLQHWDTMPVSSATRSINAESF